MLPHDPPDPGEIAPVAPVLKEPMDDFSARVLGGGDRLKSEADEARIMSLTQENKRLRDALHITDEMFERAWRAFDARAAGGADTLLDEPWFEDALRDAVAAALINHDTPAEGQTGGPYA